MKPCCCLLQCRFVSAEGCCSVTKSCLTLCDPMDSSPPGFSVHGVSKQEYWSELLFPSLWDLLGPGIEPESPALAGRFFTTEPPGKPLFRFFLCYCFLNYLKIKKEKAKICSKKTEVWMKEKNVHSEKER